MKQQPTLAINILRRVRVITPIAAVIMSSTLVACGDHCDCPGEGVWVYDCVGWIAPVCDTYCMSSGTGTRSLIPDCCCEGSSGSPSMPTDPMADTAEPVVTTAGPGASGGQPGTGLWRPIAAPCR